MKNMKMDSTTMLLLVAVFALVIYRKFAPTKVDPKNNGTEGGENGKGYSDEDEAEGVKPNVEPDLNTVVKKGSQGSAVKKVQQRMNTILYILKESKKKGLFLENKSMHNYYLALAKLNGIEADGVFGPKTEALVKQITGKTTTSLFDVRKRFTSWQKQDWQKKLTWADAASPVKLTYNSVKKVWNWLMNPLSSKPIQI